MKLIPGLYNIWLNLWGSSVHILALWGPDVVVSDRYLLKIGRSLLGTECFLSGHIITKKDFNQFNLTIGTIRIDEGAIIGARVMIAPGCHVYKNEIITAGQHLPPNAEFKDGRKQLNPNKN